YGEKGSYIKSLIADGKLYDLDDKQGEGFIQFVPKGVNGKNSLVISANDTSGLNAITDYVSERMPYLWNYGKGEYQLSDIETDVRRFFQGVNGAGQVATGLTKLRSWLDRIKDRKINSLSIELDTKESPEGLDSYIKNLVQKYVK